MLKDNSFSRDTDGNHLLRVLSLSENIATYAVELAIAGADLLACQDAGGDWTSAVAVAGVEDGESQEATETLNAALQAAHLYYVGAKEILLAIIYAIEKPDEIIEEYGVKGDSPFDFEGLHTKINKWLVTNTRLVAAADPRVVDAAIIADLTIQLDTISTLWHNAQEERREKSDAYDAKRAMFDAQCNLLSLVFGKAKLKWGNDASKLRDLGFLPSSEIWTEKKPPAPKNLTHDTGTTTWDAVEGVDLYELQCRLTDETGEWLQIYKGAETATTALPIEPGAYDFRVRAIADEDLGAWSGSIVVEVTGV